MKFLYESNFTTDAVLLSKYNIDFNVHIMVIF